MKEKSTYLFSALNGLALKMRFSSCGIFFGGWGAGIEKGNEKDGKLKEEESLETTNVEEPVVVLSLYSPDGS